MSLIFATQLTGVATAILAAFAFVAAILAYFAFRKQSREVHDQATMLKIQSDQLNEQRRINTEQAKMLELQATDLRASIEQRQLDADERRREQASQVFIWTETGSEPYISQAQRAAGAPARQTVTAQIRNTSDQPIYNAELVWHDDSMSYAELTARPDAERLAAVIMPSEVVSRTKQPGSDSGAEAVVLMFRDAANNRWLRGPEGDLMYISTTTMPLRD